jgi:hypothetical protein
MNLISPFGWVPPASRGRPGGRGVIRILGLADEASEPACSVRIAGNLVSDRPQGDDRGTCLR